MITIRKLHESEIGLLEEFCLSKKLPYEAIKDSANIVIFDGSSIIGLTTFITLKSEVALIKSIYVNVEQRGEGLGDALFRSALHHLSTIGYKSIFIESSEALKDFLDNRKHGLIFDSNINNNIRVFKCDTSILLKSKCGV